LLTPEREINEESRLFSSPYKFDNYNNTLIDDIRSINVCRFLRLYKLEFSHFRLPNEYSIIIKNDLSLEANHYIEKHTNSKNRRKLVQVINSSSILNNIREKKHTIEYIKLLFLIEVISLSFIEINELIKDSDFNYEIDVLLESIKNWSNDDILIRNTINNLTHIITHFCKDNNDSDRSIDTFQMKIMDKETLKVYVQTIVTELYSIFELLNILTNKNIVSSGKDALTTFSVKQEYDISTFIKINESFTNILESNIHTRIFFEIKYSEPYSTGEFSLLALFSKINIAIQSNKSDSLKLIFIDEIDSYIHPQWQKDIIFNLVEFINEYDAKTHIIITTHSPIVLSDIPKDNVIKLINSGNIVNDYEQCIYNDGEIESSFGSNIHNLYKDSFFLDSTIGKFAYSRITNCIKFLTDYETYLQDNISENDFEKKHIPITSISEKRKEIEYIISIIGEPIIKKKLENMYEKVFTQSNQYYKKEYYKLLEEKKTLEKMVDSSSINSVMKILDRKILELQAKAGENND
jgi:hypothetical protein